MSGIGETGKHIRFKLGCRKAYGFESHIPHQRDYVILTCFNDPINGKNKEF